MKHALITTSVVALVAGIGLACAQGMNERREAPAATPEQKAPEGQTGLQRPSAPQMSQEAKPAPTAQESEATGWGSPAVGGSSAAAASAAARGGQRSAGLPRRSGGSVPRSSEHCAERRKCSERLRTDASLRASAD